MSKLSFEKDVKCLFAKYIDDMKNVKLSTPGGTQTLYLGSYESVKQFYYEIQVAIHGYDFNQGQQMVPTSQLLPLRGGQPGQYVTSAPHPMPPQPPVGGGSLPAQAIAIFDQWVRDGMLP
jgi:hypothetical protein